MNTVEISKELAKSIQEHLLTTGGTKYSKDLGDAMLSQVISHAEDLHKFWAMVKAVDWNLDHDYKRGQRYILDNYSWAETREFAEVFKTLSNSLYTALDVYEDLGVGDDGFCDLRAEIIGRGEHLYASVISDPEIGRTMGQNHDFQESFSYCLPHKEDYDFKFEYGLEDYLAKFALKKSYYDPSYKPSVNKWDKLSEDQKGAMTILYNKLVEIGDNQTMTSTQDLVVEYLNTVDIDTLYDLAYEAGAYGFGNLLSKIKNQLM